MHGNTGYACSRITIEQLNGSIEELLNGLYKHPLVQEIPEKADVESSKTTKTQEPKDLVQSIEPWYKIRVNTHVQGTKNRHVLIMWLPANWGSALQTMERALEWIEQDNLGPCSFWRHEERIMMLCPLAIPRQKLIKMYKRRGLPLSQSKLKQNEHQWVSLSPPNENGIYSVEPELMGIYGNAFEGLPLYSRQHLELERRLGVKRKLPNHESCGEDEPSFDLVSIV